MKTCYYELLGVERTASDNEIKKAYRRKALELHPDKNMDRIEEATQLFAEVQQAYEVLSDAQERAWYDSHREQILRGYDDDDNFNMGDGAGGGGYDWTAHTVMRYFSASCYKGFDNDPNGFFAIYRKVFEEIEREEESISTIDPDSTAISDVPMFTSFGYARDKMEEKTTENSKLKVSNLKEFYDKFIHFVTCKSFRWCDKYRLSDAPDRRVKRLMEKENKKLREQARKEFQDAVRNLASFARKRDPRYAAFVKQSQEALAEKAKWNKERILEDKRKRLEEAQAFQEQDWMKVEEPEYDFDDDDDEYWEEEEKGDYDDDDYSESDDFIADGSDVEEDIFNEIKEDEVLDLYCAACDKLFKTKNQLKDHERSKKHLKAVKALKKQMEKEDSEFSKKNLPESRNNDRHLDPSTNNKKNQFDVDEEDIGTNIQNNNTDFHNEDEFNIPKNNKKKKKNKSKVNNTGMIYLSDGDAALAQFQQDELADELNHLELNMRTTTTTNVTGNDATSDPQTRIFNEDSSSITSIVDVAVDLNEEIKEDHPSPSSQVLENLKISKNEKDKKSKKNEESKELCNVCKQTFTSRNKLFKHINETGHALRISGKRKK